MCVSSGQDQSRDRHPGSGMGMTVAPRSSRRAAGVTLAWRSSYTGLPSDAPADRSAALQEDADVIGSPSSPRAQPIAGGRGVLPRRRARRRDGGAGGHHPGQRPPGPGAMGITGVFRPALYEGDCRLHHPPRADEGRRERPSGGGLTRPRPGADNPMCPLGLPGNW